MKELDVLKIIESMNITEKLAQAAAKKTNLSEDKLKNYLDEKIKKRINSIGKSLSKGDMPPEAFNGLRRLSNVDFSEINDKTIKDE